MQVAKVTPWRVREIRGEEAMQADKQRIALLEAEVAKLRLEAKQWCRSR